MLLFKCKLKKIMHCLFLIGLFVLLLSSNIVIINIVIIIKKITGGKDAVTLYFDSPL